MFRSLMNRTTIVYALLALVAFGAAADVIYRSAYVPTANDDLTNKLYVDTHAIPVGALAFAPVFANIGIANAGCVPNETGYYTPFFSSTTTGFGVERPMAFGVAHTFTTLKVSTPSNLTGAGNFVMTMRKNAVDTALVCTIAPGAGSCTATGSVAYSSTDTWSLRSVTGSTTACSTSLQVEAF